MCVYVSRCRVRLFVTPWTVALQAPLSMGFSRQEYRSGSSFPSPGDLSNPGTEPRSPALQADYLSSEPPGKSRVPSHPQKNIAPSNNPPGSRPSFIHWELFIHTLFSVCVFRWMWTFIDFFGLFFPTSRERISNQFIWLSYLIFFSSTHLISNGSLVFQGLGI